MIYERVITLQGNEADDALSVWRTEHDRFTLCDYLAQWDYGEPVSDDDRHEHLPQFMGETVLTDDGNYAVVVHFGLPMVTLYRRITE